MQPQYEFKTSLDRKFSFFKKDNYDDLIKEVRITRLKIAFFMSFVMLIQIISVDQYDKNSVSFQQKSISMSSAADLESSSSVSKLSKVELEGFLLENLNKKSLSYEDMDSLIKTAKTNKKEIPGYVYSHIVEKLKTNNEDTYKNEIKQLNYSISKIEKSSWMNRLVNPEHKEKNITAYNKSKQLIQEKYKLTEQKISEINKK